MPILLLSFKRNSDSELLIHATLTPNSARSEKAMEEHAGVCPKFGPARKAGDTIETEIEVDEIPEFTPEAVDEWLDEMFGLEDEAEEEAEEEKEDDETEDK